MRHVLSGKRSDEMSPEVGAAARAALFNAPPTETLKRKRSDRFRRSHDPFRASFGSNGQRLMRGRTPMFGSAVKPSIFARANPNREFAGRSAPVRCSYATTHERRLIVTLVAPAAI
jgi:hypothetical protein